MSLQRLVVNNNGALYAAVRSIIEHLRMSNATEEAQGLADVLYSSESQERIYALLLPRLQLLEHSPVLMQAHLEMAARAAADYCAKRLER